MSKNYVIGRIALLQVLDPEVMAVAARELVDTTAQPLEVEQRLFGLDHAAASGIVADSWNLPIELRRAVRNHHDDAHIASDDPLTALLHTADELVMSLGIGDPQPLRPHTPSPVALQRLALGAEDLEAVGQLVTTELARVGKLLNPEPALSR